MKKLNKLGIIAICVIILSALTTTATFSWLARPGDSEKAGNSMSLLSASAVVKSDGLSVTTKLAKLENGILTEGETVNAADSITIDAKSAKYFRTVVTNTSLPKNNILLGGLTLSDGTGLTVNCMSPLKTTASYSSGMAITQHLTVNANGTLNVDWYIYNSSTSSKTVTMSSLPEVLYYN